MIAIEDIEYVLRYYGNDHFRNKYRKYASDMLANSNHSSIEEFIISMSEEIETFLFKHMPAPVGDNVKREDIKILYWPDPTCDAATIPQNVHGCSYIVFNSGLLHFISFHFQMIYLLDRIDDAEVKKILRVTYDTVHHNFFHRPYHIPYIGIRFDDDEPKIFQSIYCCELFIFLHEYAHHLLKHHIHGAQNVNRYSTFHHPISHDHDIEYEADLTAIKVANHSPQAYYGCLQFFGTYGFYCNYIKYFSKAKRHPHPTERLTKIKEYFDTWRTGLQSGNIGGSAETTGVLFYRVIDLLKADEAAMQNNSGEMLIQDEKDFLHLHYGFIIVLYELFYRKLKLQSTSQKL